MPNALLLASVKNGEITKPTYVIVKSKNTWKVFYYDPGKKMSEIDVEMISALRAALNNLAPIKQLTKINKDSIENIINAYHQQYGNFLGKGNGFEIIKTIDTYILTFFNHFLKNKPNILFEKCMKISKNTVIECGE